MTRKPSRLQRRMKWAGLVVSVGVVVVSIGSARWGVQVTSDRLGWFSIVDGKLDIVRGKGQYGNPTWVVFSATGRAVRWSGHYFQRSARAWRVGVLLWLVFVIAGFPTAVLWYCDRRPPAGHGRKCGCDLTGNVSGVCSECETQLSK
jgi:hypothetical protein